MIAFADDEKHTASSVPAIGPVIRHTQSFRQIVETEKAKVIRTLDYEQAWLPGPDGKGISLSRITQTVQYPCGPSVPAITYKQPKSYKKKKVKTSKRAGGRIRRMPTFNDILKVIMWASIIGSSLLYFSWFNAPHRENLFWSVGDVTELLKASIFGQETAIDKLVAALDLTLKTELPTALILTGSIGVGKTLAASLLQKSFPWPENMHFYIAKHFADTHLVDSLRREPAWTMIVIDDCCKEPGKTMSLVTSLLNQATRKESKLLIVLSFTHRNEKELDDFFLSFERSSINHFHIPFSMLNRDAVHMCFLRELKKQGLPLIDDLIENVVDSQMDFIKEVQAAPGCKLIETKVPVYRELIRHRSSEL